MAPGQNPSLSQTAGQPQGGGVKPNPMGPAGAPPSSTGGPMVPNQSMPPNQYVYIHVLYTCSFSLFILLYFNYFNYFFASLVLEHGMLKLI